MNSGYARCAVVQSLHLSLPQKLAIGGDWLMMRSGRSQSGPEPVQDLSVREC